MKLVSIKLPQREVEVGGQLVEVGDAMLREILLVQ